MHVIRSVRRRSVLRKAKSDWPHKRLTGSAIGGIRETQEMLDFCGQHNVTADIETVGVQQLDQAYDRLLKNDVKYRFVIDMASLK